MSSAAAPAARTVSVCCYLEWQPCRLGIVAWTSLQVVMNADATGEYYIGRDLPSRASVFEVDENPVGEPPAHGRGQVVTGVGSVSPVMRTAPKVEPSRRILSDGCVPNTWP